MIFEPVESHVHGFCFLLFDGTIGDAIGSAVVGANGCGWLWMTEFNYNIIIQSNLTSRSKLT